MSNNKRIFMRFISGMLIIFLLVGMLGENQIFTYASQQSESGKIHYAADVSLDWWSSAVVNENNELYLWGQLGDGVEPLFIMDDVRKVSMGGKFGGFITKDDELYMFGPWNGYGQLGNGTTSYGYDTPIKIMDNIKDVALGYHHSAAITNNNELYLWGYNSNGQLGDGTKTNRKTPVKIMDNVAQVSLGGNVSGAITTNGDLYMWGVNDKGQIGDGTTIDRYVPTKIMSNAKKIICGGSHMGVITNNNELYVWGYNQLGQVGNGSDLNVNSPIKIMTDVKDASFGEFHSSAITMNGDLYMWGYNDHGQLGNGTLDWAYQPVKLMENVRKVSMKTAHSAAITIDGDLYMWGYNDYGQLGDGTKVDKLVPTKITMPGDDSEEYVGERSICATSEENTSYLECGDSFRILVSLYEDGEPAEYQGTFEFELSDSSIADVSDIEYTDEGTYITINGHKFGQTILEATNVQTGVVAYATVTVGDGVHRTDVNNIPVNMVDKDEYNFYVSGMYICNFYKTNKTDGFDWISMDVYNSEHIHGAVDVYDKNSNLYKSYKIDKLEGGNLTSFADTFGKTSELIQDTLAGNMLSFKAKHLSKHTHIELDVPHGGYITITNNINLSDSCRVYNGIDILVYCVKEAIEFATSSETDKDNLDKLFKELTSNKEFMKKLAEEFGKQFAEDLTVDNASEIILNFSKNSYNMLLEVDLDVWEIFDEALAETGYSISQEAFENFAGFPGIVLKNIFKAADYANFVTQVVVMYKHKEANVQRIDASSIIEEKNQDISVEEKPVEKLDISKMKVTGLSNKVYTGNQIKPNISVLVDYYTSLKKNVDYSVQYLNNINIGQASVIITGIGSYKGKIVKNFTIMPKTVKSFAQERKNSTNSIIMSWTKYSNVTGYEIYRANTKSGKYKKIKDVQENRFVDTNIKSNKVYYYKVRAYKIVNGSNIYGSFSAIKEMGPKPQKPKLVVQKNKNRLLLRWNKVGSDGYEICMKKNSDKKWAELKIIGGEYSVNAKKIGKKIYIVSSTSKRNTYAYYGAKANNKYYFKVRAYKKIGSKKVYSAWSNTKLIKIK